MNKFNTVNPFKFAGINAHILGPGSYIFTGIKLGCTTLEHMSLLVVARI